MIDSETMVGAGLRITVAKDELAAKLATVARGVSTRTAVLVLGGIQLRAEAGRLHLAATDMEVSLRASVDAQVADEGSVVVPGRLLLDIARSLPENEVSIEHHADEAVVVVTSGTATYRLHTYSAEDFPRLPDVENLALHGIDRDALVETITRVGRSASRDESRPVLTGILVRFEPGKVVMAATDSYRLAVKETPVEGTLPELEAIIPARALQELARIATGSDELQLGMLENHVVFGADGDLAHDPPHRRAVPELPPVAAGAVRARAAAAARGAARGRPPRLADGAAQFTATAAIRRRRADGVGCHARRRRGPRVAAGAVRIGPARDRVQRGVPARRVGVGRRGLDQVQADQPAAARGARRRYAATTCI